MERILKVHLYLKNEILQTDFNLLQQTKTDELNDASGRIQGSKIQTSVQEAQPGS